MRRFAHQAAAGVVLRDLRDRAAHVHVDDVGAHALDDLRGRAPSSPDRRRRSGSRPAALLRCTPAYSSVRSMPRTSPSELTISVTTSPQPPCRFTSRRKAVSVMPAIGASANGCDEIDACQFSSVFTRSACTSHVARHYEPYVRGVHFDADGLADQIDRRAPAARARPFRTSRPTTPLSGPWTTSTIMPSRISGHGIELQVALDQPADAVDLDVRGSGRSRRRTRRC